MRIGFGKTMGAPTTGPKLGPAFGSGKRRVIGIMKKGGKVKKTGLYKLHSGETVKPAPKLGKGTMERLKARAKGC
jgi:hypothetical protein